jgi:hypothetical protein
MEYTAERETSVDCIRIRPAARTTRYRSSVLACTSTRKVSVAVVELSCKAAAIVSVPAKDDERPGSSESSVHRDLEHMKTKLFHDHRFGRTRLGIDFHPHLHTREVSMEINVESPDELAV